MRTRLLRITGPLVVLLLWETSARFSWLDPRFFPPPSRTIIELTRMLWSGELLWHTVASLTRVFVGFGVGSAAGLAVGAILGVNQSLRAAVQPVIDAFYPLPKTALLPLVLLIFGLGEASRIALIALGVFFLVTINTTGGIVNVERIYTDVGRNFGARGLRYVRTIVVPAALPQIFTGLRLAWGTALILIVIAEFVGTETGLGYLTWQSWQIFAVPKMYVGLLTIGIIGAGSAALLSTLENVFIPWGK